MFLPPFFSTHESTPATFLSAYPLLAIVTYHIKAVSGSANVSINTVAPSNITSVPKTQTNPPLPMTTHSPTTVPKQTAKLTAPCASPSMEPLSEGGYRSAATPNTTTSTAEAPRFVWPSIVPGLHNFLVEYEPEASNGV